MPVIDVFELVDVHIGEGTRCCRFGSQTRQSDVLRFPLRGEDFQLVETRFRSGCRQHGEPDMFGLNRLTLIDVEIASHRDTNPRAILRWGRAVRGCFLEHRQVRRDEALLIPLPKQYDALRGQFHVARIFESAPQWKVSQLVTAIVESLLVDSPQLLLILRRISVTIPVEDVNRIGRMRRRPTSPRNPEAICPVQLGLPREGVSLRGGLPDNEPGTQIRPVRGVSLILGSPALHSSREHGLGERLDGYGAFCVSRSDQMGGL